MYAQTGTYCFLMKKALKNANKLPCVSVIWWKRYKASKKQWLAKDIKNNITKRTNEWVKINFYIKYVNKCWQMFKKNRKLTYQTIPAGISRVNVVTGFDHEEKNACTINCYKQENKNTCMVYVSVSYTHLRAHRDLHTAYRRQRQMCIRDRSQVLITKKKMLAP